MTDAKRVAIIGSGCSGIGALWALQETPHDVHLYESEDRLGGHTNTASFSHNGHSTPVDTGFIVLNSATYRRFLLSSLRSPIMHSSQRISSNSSITSALLQPRPR